MRTANEHTKMGNAYAGSAELLLVLNGSFVLAEVPVISFLRLIGVMGLFSLVNNVLHVLSINDQEQRTKYAITIFNYFPLLLQASICMHFIQAI